MTESLGMIINLAGVHADLAGDAKLLASHLAGGNAAPPGEDVADVNEFHELVIAAHSQTKGFANFLDLAVDFLGCAGN